VFWVFCSVVVVCGLVWLIMWMWMLGYSLRSCLFVVVMMLVL